MKRILLTSLFIVAGVSSIAFAIMYVDLNPAPKQFTLLIYGDDLKTAVEFDGFVVTEDEGMKPLSGSVPYTETFSSEFMLVVLESKTEGESITVELSSEVDGDPKGKSGVTSRRVMAWNGFVGWSSLGARSY